MRTTNEESPSRTYPSIEESSPNFTVSTLEAFSSRVNFMTAPVATDFATWRASTVYTPGSAGIFTKPSPSVSVHSAGFSPSER